MRPKYFKVSILKDRYPKVQKRIDELKSLLTDNSCPKPLKKDIEYKLKSIAYFDSPTGRLELLKYTKFLSITTGLDIDPYVSKIISEFELLSLNNGPVRALKVFKDCYGIATRYSVGHSFEPLKFIKSRKDGFPYILKSILPLLEGDRSERQAALGVIQVIKLVRYYPIDYSLGTIDSIPLNDTSQFSEGEVRIGNYFYEAYGKVKDKVPPDFKIRKFLYSFKKTLNRMFPIKDQQKRFEQICNNSKLHFSGRNGPNGPCLSTVVIDYNALVEDETSGLLDNIEKLTQLTQNQELQDLLNNFSEEVSQYSSTNERIPIHSKLNLKEESWGRLRPFATVDYFTHSSLKGFHNWLFNKLETYLEDCTKNQDRGSDEVRLWTASSVETESADLSEATNSIPLLVQREIVQQIAGKDFAYYWANIMSNRTFKGPSGEDLKYLTGQPMGASSSWPMLAMWHHVIVRTCMTYLGLGWGKDQIEYYYIIGDDIVLRSRELFHIYEIAVQILQNIGISKTKGFHKETNLNQNLLPGENEHFVAEFAKRIFCNGMEMTPIPPDEVTAYIQNPPTMPSMVYSLIRRDYFVDASRVQDLAKLSFDSRLALDCLFAPFTKDPFGNLSDEMEELRMGTLWFNENIYLDEINEQLYELLREQVLETFNDMEERLTDWFDASLEMEEIKVKSWLYTSRTMGEIFYKTMLAMEKVLHESLFELDNLELDPTPDNWSCVKKEIGKLQVIFDIDNVFKDINKPKEDRYRFVANILAKAVIAERKNLKQWDS